MKRSYLGRLLVFLQVALLLISFGLAVPSINVSVQEIGAGSQRLVSPVLEGSIWFSTDLSWGQLVFSKDLPAGTRIYVSLRDSNNNTLAYNYSIVLTANLTAGSVLDYDLNHASGSDRSDVVMAVVVIMTPDYQTTLTSGNILVRSRELGVGVANTTKFCTPIIINEESGNDLYNYSVLIKLDDSSNSNDPEAWKVDWNVINSTNLYFTDEAGNPLYFWVQYMDTQNRIAYIWVKIPKLTANSEEVVCLDYGVWPNPYANYQDLYKTFLFVDDLDTFNTSVWNSNSPITVDNGILELSAGQWIWTKKSFGQHYAAYISAYLEQEDGTNFDKAPNWGNILYYSLGPFIMGYIAPNNTAYSDGIGGMYILGLHEYDAKGLLVFNLPDDPDSNGYWSASFFTNANYQLQTWSYIAITLYNGELRFYQKTSDLDWGDLTTYTQISNYTISVAGNGRIGLGQWSGGPSYYGWIVVRNYVDPEPSVSVGYWYYKLVFYPQPPGVLLSSSAPSGSKTVPSVNVLEAIQTNKKSDPTLFSSSDMPNKILLPASFVFNSTNTKEKIRGGNYRSHSFR